MVVNLMTMEVLQKIMIISVTVLPSFSEAQEECGNVLEHEPSFNSLFSDIVLNSGLKLATIFEFLTVFKLRRPSFSCQTPFFPQPWPQNRIPYVILNGFSRAANQRILSDLQHVSSLTCLTFVPRDQQPYYIAFRPSPQYCYMTLNRLYDMVFAAPVTPGYPSRASFSTHADAQARPPSGVHPVHLPSEYVERSGVLGEVLVALGFNRQEVRFDRDYFLQLRYDGNVQMFQHAFRKNARTVLDTLFPYDPMSVSHISLTETRLWNVSLVSVQPGIIIRNGSDPQLSQIDIKKIQYLYCNYTTMAMLTSTATLASVTSIPQTNSSGEPSVLDAPSGVAWEELLVSQPKVLVDVMGDPTPRAAATEVLATSGAAGWRLNSLRMLPLALLLVIYAGLVNVFTAAIPHSPASYS